MDRMKSEMINDVQRKADIIMQTKMEANAERTNRNRQAIPGKTMDVQTENVAINAEEVKAVGADELNLFRLRLLHRL